MRPVNLIPDEVKRRSGRRPTGAAPYVVIAVLALAVAGVGAYVFLENRLTSKRDRLDELTAKVDETSEQAQALAGYGKFARLKLTRMAGVALVADARFPWDEVLIDIARVIPPNVWLVKVVGKVDPQAKTGTKGAGGGSGGGGAGGGGGGNAAGQEGLQDSEIPGPRVKLEGCTYRQSDVANMIARLRNIGGVKQVLLTTSDEKDETAASTGLTGASEASDDCRTRPGIHKFSITITFAPDKATALVQMVRGTAASSSSAAAGQAQSGGSSSSGGGPSPGGGNSPSPPSGGSAEPASGGTK